MNSASETAGRPVATAVWRSPQKLDNLDNARHAVKLLADDLSWARQPDALVIASHFAETMAMFPELAEVVDASELAAKIRKSERQTSALHSALIGRALAPEDSDSIEAVLLELARLGATDLLTRMIETESPTLNNAALSRLSAALGDSAAIDDAGVSKALGAVADHVTGAATLAKQRLGEALNRVMTTDADHLAPAMPAQLGGNVIGARRRLQRLRSVASVAAQDEQNAISADRLLRARDRLVTFVKGAKPALATRVTQGRTGIIDWFDYQLSLGSGALDAKVFKSTYATHDDTGALTAEEHPQGGIFQFGPYISLAPGAYHLRIFGSAAAGVHLQLNITDQAGQRTVRSNRFTINKAIKGIGEICALDFTFLASASSVEFCIIVAPGSGRLSVARIDLDYAPIGADDR